MCGCVPASGIFQNIDGLDFKNDLLALWAILSFYQSYSKEDIFVSNTGLIIS